MNSCLWIKYYGNSFGESGLNQSYLPQIPTQRFDNYYKYRTCRNGRRHDNDKFESETEIFVQIRNIDLGSVRMDLLFEYLIKFDVKIVTDTLEIRFDFSIVELFNRPLTIIIYGIIGQILLILSNNPENYCFNLLR